MARADLEKAVGETGDDIGDALHKRFCDIGAEMVFARNPARPDLEASPTDLLVFLQSIPGVVGSTPQCEVAIGESWNNSTIDGASGALQDSPSGKSIAVYGELGLAATLDRGAVVEEIDLFYPQTPNANQGRLLPLALDSQSLSVGTLTLGSSTFANITDELGGHAEMTAPITVAGAVPQQFNVRVFRSLGIQVAGACSTTCTDQALISSIALTKPFLGATAGGLGVGSSKAAFDSALGAGAPPDANEMSLYPNGVGVLFAGADDCEQRAVMIVLGYDESLALQLFTR
jgi:hypothetical protein